MSKTKTKTQTERTHAPGSLVKVTRLSIVKEHAASILPPQLVEDTEGGENHIFKCVYVTPAGQQKTKVCTFDVWKKCEGEKREGKVPTGLDYKIKNDFYVILKNDTVVGIDIIPKETYSKKGVLPETLSGKEDITLVINPATGDMEVTQIPPGTTKATVRSLMDVLDKMEVVEPNSTLTGNFSVQSISGNTLSVIPPFVPTKRS